MVIPVYNMKTHVGSAIDSVLSGDLEEVEILVIDDGSTDSSASVISDYTNPSSPKYDSRVHYEHQANQGKSVAVNCGIRRSKGDYITVLDADDELTPSSLSLRYNALEGAERPPKHLAIGEFEVFDEDGVTVGHRSVPSHLGPEYIYKRWYRAFKSPFHLNACLFSRVLYDRVGPFDTRLRRCQDIDYSLRLLKVTDHIAWINAPVYRYRKHRTSFGERVRMRRKTLLYRPLVYWKNYLGWRRYLAVLLGFALDVGKSVYEISGNYQN